MDNYIPLGSRVVIKQLKEDNKTKSGIIIPETVAKQITKGEIAAIGRDCEVVKVGDKVVVPIEACSPIEINGETYLRTTENFIEAII